MKQGKQLWVYFSYCQLYFYLLLQKTVIDKEE
jgi:hypothetical protein